MKINIIATISFASLLLFNVSCQKEITQIQDTKESIANAPIEKQRAYVSENLKAVMKELAPLFKTQSFKDYIHSEVAKKFDGDYNVLIKNLISNPIFKNQFNFEKTVAALNAFQNIGKERLYPQIYIPFFDEHQVRQNNNTLRTEIVEGETEFVIYDGDESYNSSPSYTYNEEGDIIPTGTIVTENYALNNEVYIISLNETVNPDGDPPPPIVTSPNGTQSTVNFRIQQITIKDGKESWLAGASEVHIKSNGTTWSHIISGNTSGPLVSIPNLHYTGQTEYKGHEIKKVPRSDINCGVCATYTINYPMHTDWEVDNFFIDPIVYTYSIFEYDAWPAGIKTLASKIPSAPNPNNQQDAMNFRSSNSPYGGIPGNDYINYAIYGNVTGLPSNFQYLYYDGHHINTSNIEFNTVLY